MIAPAKPAPNLTTATWQAGFVAMMPGIVKHARYKLRHLRAEARSEAVQDVLVTAMFFYVRLHQSRRRDLAYPSVLARFAVARYRDGRRAAHSMNSHDVLSPYQRRRSHSRSNSASEAWNELLIEDRHAGPAQTAAARIDFAEWFSSLSRRDQKIARALAQGDATREVAARFHVSPGRISQKRREFLDSWRRYHGANPCSP